MNRDDIEFLKSLGKTLREQDNRGQASPVYWGVMETRKKYVPDGCGDEIRWRLSGSEVLMTEDELIEYVRDNHYDNFPEDAKEEWKDITESDLVLGKDWRLTDFCDTHCGGCESFEIRYEDELSRETGCFLTESAAEEYIRKFGYNHSGPRPYAMTAYRNFELERLLNILKSEDWDKYK